MKNDRLIGGLCVLVAIALFFALGWISAVRFHEFHRADDAEVVITLFENHVKQLEVPVSADRDTAFELEFWSCPPDSFPGFKVFPGGVDTSGEQWNPPKGSVFYAVTVRKFKAEGKP